MEDETNLKNILEQKARFFSTEKTIVHIAFANGKRWARGVITEVSNEFFLMDERVQGRTMIFFAEVATIEPYQKRDTRRRLRTETKEGDDGTV